MRVNEDRRTRELPSLVGSGDVTVPDASPTSPTQKELSTPAAKASKFSKLPLIGRLFNSKAAEKKEEKDAEKDEKKQEEKVKVALRELPEPTPGRTGTVSKRALRLFERSRRSEIH